MVGNFVDFVLMSKYARRDWKGAIFTRFPAGHESLCMCASGSETGMQAM